jgi:16S rRNA (cytidine1402-2'-O)-methyltransferase
MLYLVATAIGNPKDISLRALEVLKKCEHIITEERKIGSAVIRSHDLGKKIYYELNEHSKPDQIAELVTLCETTDVALISDCGTPVFCDPGSELIKNCRIQNIRVTAVPGASSLMVLLSLSSRRLNQFLFYGFLPQKTEERRPAYMQIKKSSVPVILMDTPYRFAKTVSEIKEHMPEKNCLLGVDLTTETEIIFEGKGAQLDISRFPQKAEFIAMIY